MKVFISHKQEDSSLALFVQSVFTQYDIDTYLDVLDSTITGDGKTLTDHIKRNLNSCSDLVVVMSEQTKASWWVPFEIGMSAQLDMPTATFLRTNISLPDYLSYWPRLRSIDDIKKYVLVRDRIHKNIRYDQKYFWQENQKEYETKAFYDALKRELR